MQKNLLQMTIQKNQIYLGADFSALNIIPHQNIYSDSNEVSGSKRDRAKADICFFWIDNEGKYTAPDAQLILYPKYPEIRMSGLLKGCRKAPSKVINARDVGRVIFLGITDKGEILGYATSTYDPISQEFFAKNNWVSLGLFHEIPSDVYLKGDTKHQLISNLKDLYNKQWIPSKKMKSDGTITSYSAQNGGGYTLEAELGISPNSYAEPDYLGWEIKQYAVHDFVKYRAKSPVTLFTPEPTGGIYREEGLKSFLLKYGYPDKAGIQNRINFGGYYTCGKSYHKDTSLKLQMIGFNKLSGKITDIDGGIALISKNDEIAAMWHFVNLMKHWNRKHAQAAYIPSIYQTPPPQYAFGPRILLCEKTDFTLFLKGIASGSIYYDPGIKYEKTSNFKGKIKRRSQFRIIHSKLTSLYHKSEIIELIENM